MKKDAKIVDSRSWFILPAILACLPIRAGGVFCSSNQSAEYIPSFDRNSAIDDADIAYYNMPGTVFLRPGLSFNLSNQTILQRATVRTLGNPVLGDRTYVSHDPVWLVPNVYGVWRGGGRALFDVSSRALGCSLEFGIDFRCHLPR
jgi:hypothetical protein